MAGSKAYYVTTPIYYVNDAPHIGHAYTTTAGDALTRWHRQRGAAVWFLTGTDEHGTKVARTAAEHSVAPQQWADRLVAEAWRPALGTIDAANDDFIRTTEPRHVIGVQRFWEQVRANGALYQGVYEGPYCVGCEEFKLPGDVIEGSGEQAGALICPLHGRPVELLREENWFFRLSAYAEELLAHYRRHPDAVAPRSAYNEVVAFIERGLTDISMSRSAVQWGVPLPWQPEQVVYVWFDALLNYITAIGYAAEPGSPQAQRFATTWPADVHLVGKDILRFHAVYWPAMLLAAGLPLPRQVFAHGWLLVSGEKMSKSRLTGIAPSLIVDHVGSDAFRYYFLSAIRFGSDGSFSWEDLTARYTAELANGLGNLLSRAVAMVDRYCAGEVPAAGPQSTADIALAALAQATVGRADAAIDELDFAGAIGHIRDLVDATNLYLTEEQPWVLARAPEQRERLHSVLATACEVLRIVAVLYHPVMPHATERMWHALGATTLGPLAEQRIDETGRWGQLPVGARVVRGEPLFPRLADPDPPEAETAGMP
ncbi:MAG: methionine--tRNA ligase [Actinomycetales bacterium]|nr:methionine--tRNA ligase [Actinomycetales bacterium]